MFGLVGYPETRAGNGLVGYPQTQAGSGLVGPLLPVKMTPEELARMEALLGGLPPGADRWHLKEEAPPWVKALTLPARAATALVEGAAQSAWKGLTLPGDVYAGKVDPNSDDGFSRVMDLAGTVPMGPLVSKTMRRQPLTPEDTSASRSPMLYDPPMKPPRPFEADYPGGAPPDEAGNLKFDIERRPLVAKYVVGRKVVGGDDQAFPPEELNALAEAITGEGITRAPPTQLGRDVGRFLKREDRRTVIEPDGREAPAGMSGDGWERFILLRDDLDADAAVRVAAHEIGHSINDFAGSVAMHKNGVPFWDIPTAGIKKELRLIYNDLNNPDLNGARAAATRTGSAPPDPSKRSVYRNYGPETRGYSGADAQSELIVEAIRAYMADPNYIKTVAPKTAAAIRKVVNENPRLAKTIQFNVGGVPIGIGDTSSGVAPMIPADLSPEERKQLAREMARQAGVTGEVY